MATEKVLILDGTIDESGAAEAMRETLSGVLVDSGAEVRVLSGADLKMTNCIGCFGCWLETPGLCRFKESANHELLRAWVSSDTVVLLTPVTFGGYSWRLKQVIDRSLPILLPYMAVFHGEVHHRPRYSKRPRLIAIGIQDTADPREAATFRLLAGRHAVDCQAPSFAAEVVSAGDVPDRLRETFRALLTRRDAFPRGKAIESAAPAGTEAMPWSGVGQGRRACLIVGSPKTRSASTSGVIGNRVLDQLHQRGWETEALTLKATSFAPEGEAALLRAVDAADLLLLAFPLYVDGLPSLLTRAVERIAAHRAGGGERRPLGLAIIINNGFPESFQNNVALSICRNFAGAAGMVWLGGFALGAGESVVGGDTAQGEERVRGAHVQDPPEPGCRGRRARSGSAGASRGDGQARRWAHPPRAVQGVAAHVPARVEIALGEESGLTRRRQAGVVWQGLTPARARPRVPRRRWATPAAGVGRGGLGGQ